jgi:hypothetical protein
VRVNSLCGIGPERAIGSYERCDLSARQLDPLIAQSVQGSERITEEPQTILFVGDESTDEQLDRLLRHGFWRFWSASPQRFRRDLI